MLVGKTLHIFVSAQNNSLQSTQRKKAGDKVSNVLQRGVLNESDFTSVACQLQVLEIIERRVARRVALDNWGMALREIYLFKYISSTTDSHIICEVLL